RLREVSRALNDVGYQGLGRLLSRVCVLRLDAEVAQSAWRRAWSERVGQTAPPLDVSLPASPVLLRIYRSDLDDVLTNLLRNAIEAGADRVAVRVELEQDEVTGLERAAIRVCDE